MKETDHLEHLSIGGRIILKMDLEYVECESIDLISLAWTETSGGLLP